METEVPAKKRKIYTALKVTAIVFLVLAISFLAIMHWKSDAIIRKVLTVVQGQMADSLQYEDVSFEWLRYFPNAALRLEDVNVGTTKSPFVKGGNVDVVLKLFPLLREQIVINRLKISNSNVFITKNKSRWSYEVFKKIVTDTAQQAALAEQKAGSAWNALIRKIEIENTLIHYNDYDGTSFIADITDGSLEGAMNSKLLDAELDITGSLDSFRMDDYHQFIPFHFALNGGYKYDLTTGTQELINWHIKNDGITIETNGLIKKEEDRQWMDFHATWNDGDPQVIKSMLPAQKIK
ncbi:MAG: AsmA family protein, partial [Bacteroidota bacterium]|nr:AsmA family protein [Bacteroidota bacterium]